MNEEWKDIAGFGGEYQISSLGRIRSLKKWRGITGRIFTGWKTKNGYRQVYLGNKPNGKYFHIHRLVASYFIDNKNNFNCVNHKDCNKENNSFYNLEWCSYSLNLSHAYKNGLRKNINYAVGDRNWNTKLSANQVNEIREKYKKGKYAQDQNGYSSIKLAKEYGVSKTAILNIIKNKCHKSY